MAEQWFTDDKYLGLNLVDRWTFFVSSKTVFIALREGPAEHFDADTVTVTSKGSSPSKWQEHYLDNALLDS